MRFSSPSVVGSFEEFPLVECGSCPHKEHQVWCVDGSPAGLGWVWADSMSLNAIATPAALEPGPLVTRCRSRTVANVDSIGFVVRKCTQC